MLFASACIRQRVFFYGVRVADLFSFCVILFVFVLCLVCPVLPMFQNCSSSCHCFNSQLMVVFIHYLKKNNNNNFTKQLYFV
jgi:hypothetical protein